MRPSILCVDDDRDVLDELGSQLGGRADLIHCRDLDEALEIAVCEEPDLVLLETRLAAGNGLDFAERLRGHAGSVGATPIVVVTQASRTPSIYGRAMQLGVARYLTKPVSPMELAACVQDLLGPKREAPADANGDSGVQRGIGAGKLAELPVPELLDRVHRRGESGVLIVGDARERVGIQIRNGSPTSVTRPRSESLADFLVRSGRLSGEERDRVVREAAGEPSQLDEVLLATGVLDEAALDDALDEWAEESVLELFALDSGRYRFEPGRKLRGTRSLEIMSSAHGLIVRGVLAWAPLERVRHCLARYADLYVAAAANPEPVAEDVPFSDAQREFIPTLTGDRTVRDLRDGSEFELRTLYAFAILGAIDLLPDPSLVLDEAVDDASVVEALPDVGPAAADALLAIDEPDAAPDFSFEDELFEARAFEEDSFEMEMVAPEPAFAAAPDLLELDAMVTAQLDAAPLADEAVEAAPPAPEPELEGAPEAAQSARDESGEAQSDAGLGSGAERPDEVPPAPPARATSTDLAVIEPEPSSGSEEPPGSSAAPSPADTGGGYEIPRIGHIHTSPEERALVAKRVKKRAGSKYKHLVDRQSEALPDDRGDESPSGEPAAARALEAESWFRKGRGLLKSRHYDRAAEAFGMSSHLDPEQGEYVAHLGYALYLRNPDDDLVRREALEDIARGIKLSPDRELPYVFLGRIFKVKGDMANAEKMFRRAVEIRPHCREAVQELRLIEMRGHKKGGGLLGRFLK